MTDQDVAEHLEILKKCRVTVHIRGTDSHPVIEFTDPSSAGSR
jgi:hypothetical protein